MKNLKSRISDLKERVAGLLRPLAVAGLALLGASTLQAQSVSPRVYDLGEISLTNATTATVNVATNLWLPMLAGHHTSVEVIASSSAANTSTITNVFDLSLDGTNYSTTGPLSCVSTLNGTNVVRDPHIFLLTSLDSFKSIRWSTSGGNATNTTTKVRVRLGVVP